MDPHTHGTPGPPKRRRVHDENEPICTPTSTSLQSPPILSTSPSLATSSPVPETPLTDKKNRKIYRNGYEVKPKTLSFKPYSVNTPGRARQQAFAFPTFKSLKMTQPLTEDAWTKLATRFGLLKDGQKVQDFQVEAANRVLSRVGDLCVVAPTGSGKSLLWMLPLLPQKVGISLVIIPFTSLGFQGEQRHQNMSINCTFLHSGTSSEDLLRSLAEGGERHVIYACPEMLETPAVAKVLFSASFQAQLSGVYLDEAHSVHETPNWRPSYGRIHLLRKILGLHIPFIALSATCPKRYRQSLEVHAGLLPNYHLINLGNFRPELSTVVTRMKNDASSFLDLQFIVPMVSTSESIKQTIVYCDDLDMLTDMLWWFHARLETLQLPTKLVDILHAGLSEKHQETCTNDFMSGKTRVLLGSDKIGAGVDFPHVTLVVQYRCRDLTLVRLIQRFGRGARSCDGATAIGVVIVEKSMTGDDGELSMESPKFEDPALLDFIHTVNCQQAVVDLWLENPARLPHTPCTQCSNCNKDLAAITDHRDLVWIPENMTEAQSSSTIIRALNEEERKKLLLELVQWRLEIWQTDWKDNWPRYGPHSLINDDDLLEIVKRAHTIQAADDIDAFAHILHLDELADSLITQISRTLTAMGVISVAQAVEQRENPDHAQVPIPAPQYTSIRWAENHNMESIQAQEEVKREGELALNEFILRFD